ncbi:hypothetical protein MSPP1_002522 [Malassezia sp. CBS 17886]|nr:hypothetical protein MSPP1_002522 [Malassezia sp. CBS 17886]
MGERMDAADRGDTVSAVLGAQPEMAPHTAMKKLAGRGGPLHHFLRGTPTGRRAKHWDWHNGAVNPRNAAPSDDECARVRALYGYAAETQGGPSTLYTQLLADCLLALGSDPFINVTSPALLATTGTIPLSIFSTGPDIIQHYYECIVVAKREVVLLTNYWQPGKNVAKIADALRTLNERTRARGDGSRIVVKIMWDRGPRTVADLFRNRTPVLPSAWEPNGLPSDAELTHMDMQILNYHRPLMGTFHAKLLLVDRNVALVNSINIQDRPNLEACIRLEGDIVNSVYDHALISWGVYLRPALPCIASPAPREPAPSAMTAVSPAERERRTVSARTQLTRDDQETMEQQQVPVRMQLADLVEHVMHARAGATDRPTSTPPPDDSAVRHAASVWLNKVRGKDASHDGGGGGGDGAALPFANSALRLLGKDRSSSWNVHWASPRLSSADKEHAADRLATITSSLDFANLSRVRGELNPTSIESSVGGWDAQQLMGLLDFNPFLYHAPHAPVPMALVNRRPWGRPGHDDLRNPQAAAWLAGFRYAQKHVFIQSPTLNAKPVRAAILACVRRGVRVELWLDLGFNDKSESMPFQGGTNEDVVFGLYKALRRDGRGQEHLLDVYWYTGKDMDRPLNAARKQRNCHVKFAAFDGQSWFHSQEINVMIDSRAIVSEWLLALRRNQSTHIYGRVDPAMGVWRGKSGTMADTGRD